LKPAGSDSLKNRNYLIFGVLNALDLLSTPYRDGLDLLNKVLKTYSINGSSPIAHALFVASRRFGLYSWIEVRKKDSDNLTMDKQPDVQSFPQVLIYGSAPFYILNQLK
jgi:hypothetical protein